MHRQRFTIAPRVPAPGNPDIKSSLKHGEVTAFPGGRARASHYSNVLLFFMCAALVIILFLLFLVLPDRLQERFHSSLVNSADSLPLSPSGDGSLAISQRLANLMRDNSTDSQWELIHRETLVLAHAAGLDSVFFNDSDNGWALTVPTLFKLSDQGKTWTPVLTNEEVSRAYYGISFPSANVGFVVGTQKLGDLYTVMIMRTSDGGKSWEDLPVDVRADKKIEKGPSLYSVSFCGEKSGWAVGSDLILHTSDGGNSWQSQKFDVEGKERLLTVTCVGPERAWAAGSDGLVLQTDDGGQTWTRQDVGTKATLIAIRFFGNDGWMVAGGYAKGLLIKTSDQGKTWQPQQLDTSEGFFDIFFLGSQGWLSGENGTLLRTTDAGKTWVRQRTPTRDGLTSLFFLSPDEGWAGGEKLTLLRLESPGTTPAIEPQSLAAITTKPLPLPVEVNSGLFGAEWPLRVGQTLEKSAHRRTAPRSTQPYFFREAPSIGDSWKANGGSEPDHYVYSHALDAPSPLPGIPLSGKNRCDFSSYRPFRIEQFDPRAVVKRVQPDYPPEAVERGIQGRVSVKALINEKGIVARSCAMEGEGLLQGAAERATLQWKFRPGYGIAFLRPRTRTNPKNFAEAYIIFDFKLDQVASK